MLHALKRFGISICHTTTFATTVGGVCRLCFHGEDPPYFTVGTHGDAIQGPKDSRLEQLGRKGHKVDAQIAPL